MAYQLKYDLSSILSQSEIDDIDGGTDTFRSNKAYVFEPTPLITMNDTWERQPNEDKIRRLTNLTISGTFVNVGSGTDPNGLSNSSTLEDIYEKRKLLSNCLANDRGDLILETDLGQNVFTFQPTIESVNFNEGVWVNRLDYSIEATAESEYSDQRIIDGSDAINVTFNAENDTIEVQRTISATGMVYRYGSSPDEKIDAVDNAKVWVLSKLDNSNIEDVQSTSDLTVFLDKYRLTTVTGSPLWDTDNIPDTIFPDADYTNTIANSFTESSDSYAGTYQIDITYVKAKKLAIVDVGFDVSRDGGSQVDNVTINGTITGLGINSDTRYANAVTVYNQLIGLSSLSGGDISIPTDNLRTPRDFTKYSQSNTIENVSLPTTLTDLSLQNYSRNIDEERGTISFTFTYNNETSLYGSKYAVSQFDFSVTKAARQTVSIPIPYRAAGPVVQDIKTISSKEISVSIAGVVTKKDVSGNTVKFNPTDAMFDEIINAVFNSSLFASSFKTTLIADLLTNVSDTSNLSSSLSTTTLKNYSQTYDPIKRSFSLSRVWLYNT